MELKKQKEAEDIANKAKKAENDALNKEVAIREQAADSIEKQSHSIYAQQDMPAAPKKLDQQSLIQSII